MAAVNILWPRLHLGRRKMCTIDVHLATSDEMLHLLATSYTALIYPFRLAEGNI